MSRTLRPIKVVKDYVKHAEGSCLFIMGETRVLCVASVEDRRPPHAEEQNIGWLSAEYAMLPRAGNKRTPRGRASGGGRAQEISRLIGRSLRASVDLSKLGPRSVVVDCDVIQADGGTRTASINGGMIALTLALKKIYGMGVITEWPVKHLVAAVSVGIVHGIPSLDIAYIEDQAADSDFNFVMTENRRFVEVQGSAEHNTFTERELLTLTKMAGSAIRKIVQIQKKAVGQTPKYVETAT